MGTGAYDGTPRDDYFQGVGLAVFAELQALAGRLEVLAAARAVEEADRGEVDPTAV